MQAVQEDRGRTSAQVLLAVRDLRVNFAGTVALGGVSLDVDEGELFGLIGPNGAGKTTLIEAISGFLPNAEGDITFDGRALRGLRPDPRGAWGRGLLDLVRWSRWPAEARKAVDDALELLGITQYADELPSQLPNGVRKLV